MLALETSAGESPEDCLKIAIVGSGPSGFYAAEALLASGLPIEVDMLERLPVPFGLVRYGVAPDHAKLKSVTEVFAAIARDARFRFFGHVELGRDVDIATLSSLYNAVIVATGAAGDRKLGIPGEDLRGVHGASDFVAWYNGRPDAADIDIDLSQDTAVVVGQGNVALDVCRILAKPVEELRRTDIADHALKALERSKVRDIHLVGRRGPVQAKFSAREFRELSALPGWQLRVDPACLVLGAACEEELADPANPHAAKNIAVLRKCVATPDRAERGRIHLHFLTAPDALVGEGPLRQVVLEQQTLQGPAGEQTAVGTGVLRTIDAGLLFRSVGYRGAALPGLPFDERLGIVPNVRGRIVDRNMLLRGIYVTGWIKRGPVGIIGTNRVDSIETVASLREDAVSLRGGKPGRFGLAARLDAMSHRAVSFEHWLHIEQEELRRGELLRKVSEKFVSIEEMLAAAHATAEEANA